MSFQELGFLLIAIYLQDVFDYAYFKIDLEVFLFFRGF